MPDEPTLSRDQLDDRIAILRDNIRQLTEQAAAVSGAASEAFIADRIADQQAELDRLIRQRDALLARMGNASAPTSAKTVAKKTVARKAVRKAAKKAATKKKAGTKRPAKTARKAAKKKAAARKPAKKTKKAAKKKKK
jgi:hypothetical protein